MTKQQAAKEIEKKIKEAERLINECTELADEHQVVFHYRSGDVGTYTPEDRVGTELEDSDLDDPGECDGWQHSSIC